MIASLAELFVLLLGAFVAGSIVGAATRGIIGFARYRRARAELTPPLVAVPVPPAARVAPEATRSLTAETQERRPPTPTRPAEARASAGEAPIAAAAAPDSGAVLRRTAPTRRLTTPEPEVKRRIQTSLKTARAKRPVDEGRGRTQDPAWDWEGTSDPRLIPRPPRIALPAPRARAPSTARRAAESGTGGSGAKLPAILQSPRPADVWGEEHKPAPAARREAPPAGKPLNDGDETWPAPPGDWPLDRRRATPVGRAPMQLESPAAMRKRLARGGGKPSSLPVVAGPRSDEIWLDSALAREPKRARPASAWRSSVLDGGDGRPPLLEGVPLGRDNLRRIRGIGEGFEKRLNELGVFRFDQIAQWSSDEQKWIGNELGYPGRVERDGWVGQAARILATRRSAPASQAKVLSDP